MKMRTNLHNLKTLYDTASGELPANKTALDYYWSVVFSIEHLGCLLENCSKNEYHPILSDKTLSQLLYVYDIRFVDEGEPHVHANQYVIGIRAYSKHRRNCNQQAF